VRYGPEPIYAVRGRVERRTARAFGNTPELIRSAILRDPDLIEVDAGGVVGP
jgi:hypothetical protein